MTGHPQASFFFAYGVLVSRTVHAKDLSILRQEDRKRGQDHLFKQTRTPLGHCFLCVARCQISEIKALKLRLHC